MANGTFSYGLSTPPYTFNGPIDAPRFLVSDTVQFAADGITPIYIFSDQEILAVEQVITNVFQSGMFFSTPGGPPGGGTLGANLPSYPIPYYRVAAVLLTSLAANSARLASVIQILDVKLSPSLASKALREQAQAYLDLDDNSGAFMIIEMVNDDFSFRDRFYKQVQRQGWAG